MHSSFYVNYTSTKLFKKSKNNGKKKHWVKSLFTCKKTSVRTKRGYANKEQHP